MQLPGKECREDTGTGRVMDEARDPWVMVLIPCGGTESLESLLTIVSAYFWNGKKL